MGNGNQVVWILGAGFSKALGAPLMNELFSPSFMNQMDAHFPDVSELHTGAAIWPARIYERGSKSDFGLWSNVEQFADYVCDATSAEDGAPARLLRKIANELRKDDEVIFETVAALHGATTRMIAAQCCAFMRGQKKEGSEKWLPYVEWAGRLGKDDTIVTFNYDRVVEFLNSNMRVLLPREINVDVPMWDQGFIYKMHGSVDWRRDEKTNELLIDQNKEFAVVCRDKERVIATPGPAKYEASTGELSSIWRAAMRKLKEADAIVFVGYRMPDSDSFAEMRITEMLKENQAQHEHVHLILHTDRNAQDRLVKLLDTKLPIVGRRVKGGGNETPILLRYWLRDHAPLGAREFLTIDRRKLFEH